MPELLTPTSSRQPLPSRSRRPRRSLADSRRPIVGRLRGPTERGASHARLRGTRRPGASGMDMLSERDELRRAGLCRDLARRENVPLVVDGDEPELEADARLQALEFDQPV